MESRAHIFISDLRLQARVGVNPGEQGAEQPVVIDIWVGVDSLPKAARTERLRHTVDYVGVTHAAREVVAARHYPLVESLATHIAEAVLDRPGAAWARVRLRKLKCLRYASGAGVEVELHREERSPEPVPDLLDRGEEVVIVGGGVAGMAAALWCARLGHPALLVDAGAQLGGQLHMVHGLMEDIPATPPMTGAQLAAGLWRQFAQHGGRWVRGRLTGIEEAADACHLAVELDGKRREVAARVVILAVGVRRRELGVAGERELLGRGVLHTGAKGHAALTGRHVAVVGGGDAAYENALILARAGAHVTLLHRGETPSARLQFRGEVARERRITVRPGTEVRRFVGEERLEALELETPGGAETLAAHAALVRVGWVPNSGPLPAAWRDERGFVRAGPDGQVPGAPRVFVAGDLLGRPAPSVAASCGTAATAAAAAVVLLERTA